jgi:hypothetical protein
MFAYTYQGNPVEITESANNLIIEIQGHPVCLKLVESSKTNSVIKSGTPTTPFTVVCSLQPTPSH